MQSGFYLHGCYVPHRTDQIGISLKIVFAEDVGFEPTYRFRMAVFKTAPVPIEAILQFERNKRFELSLQPWEGWMLPLHQFRKRITLVRFHTNVTYKILRISDSHR